METKDIDNAIGDLVGIGFCQPRFYLPTVWKYADKMMKRGVALGHVAPFDFGRGKGKYTSERDNTELAAILKADPEARQIAENYAKYLKNVEKRIAGA